MFKAGDKVTPTDKAWGDEASYSYGHGKKKPVGIIQSIILYQGGTNDPYSGLKFASVEWSASGAICAADSFWLRDLQLAEREKPKMQMEIEA